MKKAFAVMAAAMLSVLLFISCNNSVTVPETCTVTLKYSDNTTTTDTVLKGGTFTFPSYEKDGKTVTEYRDGEKTYSVGEKIEVSSSMTFTAELVTPSSPEASADTYSLVVISKDTVVESKVVKSGEKYTLPDYSSQSGFRGWKVGEETKSSNDVITVTANTAVTALWEAEPVTEYFTVVVISKDSVVDTKYLAKNSEYTLPAAPEGSGFKGWKVGEETELKAAESTITITANTTVKADWTLTEKTYYSVVAISKDSVVDSKAVENGSKYRLPAAPAGDGFKGWKVGEDTKAAETEIDITANTTVTAVWEAKEYFTVVVISKESVVANESVEKDAMYTLPSNTETGFTKWKVGSEKKNAGETIKVSSNTTVVAEWTPEPDPVYYSLVVISKGTVYHSDAVLSGATYTLPTLEGTGFKGWRVGSSAAVTNAGTEIDITANTTVTAVWDEGTSTTPSSDTYYAVAVISKDRVVASAAVKKDETYILPASQGDGFLGWKVGEETTTTAAGASILISADTTVTAVWEAKEYFTVVVISKESVVANESVEKGTTYTLPSNNESGFTKWKVGSEKKNAGETITVSADTTVVAEWTPEPDPVYYSLVVLSKGTVYHSDAVLSGSKYTLPTPEGTGFKGWKVGTETALTVAGTEIDITADTTVTAEWEAETSVSYYSVVAVSNGSVVESKAVAAGSEYTLPSSQGTGFRNWKVGDTTYDAGAVITISADTTVTAEWEGEVSVEYFAVVVMNGSTIVEAKAVQSGKEYTLPSSTGITAFGGWKVGSEVKNAGDKITITGNTEVTIKLNLCTVTFDGNGGSSTPSIAVEGGSKGYAPVPPHRHGYIFTKWTTDPDGNKEFNLGTTPITGDMTLYAQWESYSDPYLNVGDEGPGGGYIFYVNENDAVDGWKYLEITKTSIGSYMFGYYYDGSEFTTVGTSSAIGSGKENTNKLLVMGDSTEKALGSYTVGGSRSEYAAQKCKEYRGGGYSDWFLPSIGELTQLISSTVVTDYKIDRSALTDCMSSTEKDYGDVYIVAPEYYDEAAYTPRDDSWTRPVYAVRMF